VEDGALRVYVNEEPMTVESGPGEYIPIRRSWTKGDSVRLRLPMHVDLVQMPDGSDFHALRYGPVVLAAETDPFEDERLEYLSDDSRMGHVPQGALCPLDRAPVLVGDVEDVKRGIKRTSDGPLTFVLHSGVDAPQQESFRLVPFFRVHDSRYVVYWPALTKDELQQFRSAGARTEQARLALEGITIDRVAPGEQQPESEHSLKGEGTESGVNMRRRWRHASGWFSYILEDHAGEAKLLQVTYFGADRGRHFDILVNHVKIATVALEGEHGAEFYAVEYPIPAAVVDQSNGTLETKFVAHEGSIAGGVYSVRLLRETALQESTPES
jgi:hypothetical protein